jgi:hypothetical protein
LCFGLPFDNGAARCPANASTFYRKRSLPKAQASFVAARMTSKSAFITCARKSCR